MSDKKALPPRSKHTLLIQARVSKWSPDEVYYSVITLEHNPGYYDDQIGKAAVDEYGTITKILEVRDLVLELPQWEGVTAADIAVDALRQNEQKIRADFTKALEENRARIESYLAIPMDVQAHEHKEV